METQDFMDKLLSQASLDEVDFACDLERVLADQVRYLRGLLAERGQEQRLACDVLVRGLWAQLADKEREVVALREENVRLRLKSRPPG